MSNTTDLEWDLSLPITVDYDYEPYVPARISGPPENCYPAEGGYVSINDVLVGGFSILSLIPQAELERISDHIYCELAEAEAEADWDGPDPEPDHDS